MGKKESWIGKRGEEIQHTRLAILRAGWAGKVIDRSRDRDAHYDLEIQRPNLFANKWDIERHEIKSKSPRSRTFPGLTPKERIAREEYGDEYYVDEVEIPPYEDWFYDQFMERR